MFCYVKRVILYLMISSFMLCNATYSDSFGFQIGNGFIIKNSFGSVNDLTKALGIKSDASLNKEDASARGLYDAVSEALYYNSNVRLEYIRAMQGNMNVFIDMHLNFIPLYLNSFDAEITSHEKVAADHESGDHIAHVSEMHNSIQKLENKPVRKYFKDNSWLYSANISMGGEYFVSRYQGCDVLVRAGLVLEYGYINVKQNDKVAKSMSLIGLNLPSFVFLYKFKQNVSAKLELSMLHVRNICSFSAYQGPFSATKFNILFGLRWDL